MLESNVSGKGPFNKIIVFSDDPLYAGLCTVDRIPVVHYTYSEMFTNVAKPVLSQDTWSRYSTHSKSSRSPAHSKM